MKIMASSPITSWEIDGETMEIVRDFIFLDSKIIADGDCSHEIKSCLLLGRKVMTNLDSILEKAMATQSSTLAWKIPWTEEPGGLQSKGSQRVVRILAIKQQQRNIINLMEATYSFLNFEF